jgi:hypothetical protein
MIGWKQAAGILAVLIATGTSVRLVISYGGIPNENIKDPSAEIATESLDLSGQVREENEGSAEACSFQTPEPSN